MVNDLLMQSFLSFKWCICIRTKVLSSTFLACFVCYCSNYPQVAYDVLSDGALIPVLLWCLLWLSVIYSFAMSVACLCVFHILVYFYHALKHCKFVSSWRALATRAGRQRLDLAVLYFGGNDPTLALIRYGTVRVRCSCLNAVINEYRRTEWPHKLPHKVGDKVLREPVRMPWHVSNPTRLVRY